MADCEQSVSRHNVAPPPVTEFRFSARRQVWVSAVVLLAFAAVLIAVNLVQGRPWWNLLPFFGLVVVVSAVLNSRHKRGPRLPVRLTDKELQVTGQDGTTLVIDLSNIQHAYIHRRWMPYLVVKVVDPSQTQPPLPLWQRPNGQLRPDEIAIRLAYMTPGPNVLRRELTRRFPTTVQSS